MAQEYLPAPSNIRLADLMKEHNISQPELAKELGCSKSTINRFISGAKGTLTHEQVLKIARLFNVSTDFLLGETNIPDRKNYDIAELGLSVEAAKNLYTGRVNTEVVNLLLENARFAELTYRISQYFDDTFASGIAAQNAMLTTLSTLLRTRVKTPEAAKAAKDISLRRKPVYQGDLDDIEMYFMAAVKEIKKGIGSHYAEQEAMSKKVAEKMFTELKQCRIVSAYHLTVDTNGAQIDQSWLFEKDHLTYIDIAKTFEQTYFVTDYAGGSGDSGALNELTIAFGETMDGMPDIRITVSENGYIQINGKRAYPLSLKYAGNRLYGHLLECLQDGADRQQ